jgi:hypothetical protein
MVVYDFDKWDGMNENRVTPISLARFEELLRLYCHVDHRLLLYKNIVEPNFKLGFFFKSEKKMDSYLQTIRSIQKDSSFPDRDESITCYNFIESDTVGVTYVVIPFLNSMFAISTSKDAPECISSCKKGYWKGEVKWLEQLPKRELWTDYPCLLMEKDIWDMWVLNKKASK